MDRTVYTQDQINQRSTQSGNSPAQQRLTANDAYTQRVNVAKQQASQIEALLKETDAAITALASPSDPSKRAANNPRDQQALDALLQFRGGLAPDGTASGLLAKVMQARQAVVDATAAGRESPAVSGTTARPATQPAVTPATQPSGPVQIRSEADYLALPPGAEFFDDKGNLRRKGG
jgi:hypothetical protein